VHPRDGQQVDQTRRDEARPRLLREARLLREQQRLRETPAVRHQCAQPRLLRRAKTCHRTGTPGISGERPHRIDDQYARIYRRYRPAHPPRVAEPATVQLDGGTPTPRRRVQQCQLPLRRTDPHHTAARARPAERHRGTRRRQCRRVATQQELRTIRQARTAVTPYIMGAGRTNGRTDHAERQQHGSRARQPHGTHQQQARRHEQDGVRGGEPEPQTGQQAEAPGQDGREERRHVERYVP
jgi:hypothetical protein